VTLQQRLNLMPVYFAPHLQRPPIRFRARPRSRPRRVHPALRRPPVVHAGSRSDPLASLAAQLPGVGAAVGPARAIDQVLSAAPLPVQIIAAPLFLGTGVAKAIGGAVADIFGGPSPSEIVNRLVQQLTAQRAAAPAPAPIAAAPLLPIAAATLGLFERIRSRGTYLE